MLEVKSLSKRIKQKEILKNISFSVSRGEIALFLGSSGAGKSTLLRVLAHLESYDQGSFFLDGIDLDLSKVNKNQTVGMLFQQFHLFENLTVQENIMLALIKCQKKNKAEAKEIAKTLLTQYDLEDKADVSVHNLSGGQKQRVALARTLALSPPIISLDEPTSALDPQRTKQVAKIISKLKEANHIVLLTTHDTGLISELDAHIFLMNDGAIIEKARTKEYREAPVNYPKLQQFLGQ